MQRLLPAGILAILLVACGGPVGSALTLPHGVEVRTWGDGSYGLVLVPDAMHGAASWDSAARTFADEGMTVVAVGEAEADAVTAALRHLLEERGIERAALMGAGTGAEVAIQVTATQPELVDQLIVLSASGDISGLGDLPKLFVASGGEAAAADAQRMASSAAGRWNDLYLAEGDASGQEILAGEGRQGAMEAILRRLNERR